MFTVEWVISQSQNPDRNNLLGTRLPDSNTVNNYYDEIRIEAKWYDRIGIELIYTKTGF